MAVALLLGGGCAARSSSELPILAQAHEPDAPLSLALTNASRDAEVLHVDASVTAYTNFPAERVAVQISGYGEGKLVREKIWALKDVIVGESANRMRAPGAALEPGMAVPIGLTIGAENLTDYKVELLWGEDAASTLAEKNRKPAIGIHRITLTQVPGECPTTQCPARSAVNCELENRGDRAVNDITLGMNFLVFRDALDLSKPSPDDGEQIVRLTNLGLGPGEVQPVRLVLSPEQTAKLTAGLGAGGMLPPVLRVIETRFVE